MDLQAYLEKRKQHQSTLPIYRDLCDKCLQPDFGCYCGRVRPFDCEIHFVILIHPIEVRRRIATGRMSHLCLKGSNLIMGQNYSDHPTVNRLISEDTHQSFVLYPGMDSINLTYLEDSDRTSLFTANKKLRLFVIDGTWGTARSMMNQSANLKQLPRLSFSPDRPSNFRVRKQPKAHCLSTIEAIHHTIDLILSPAKENRPHDNLLEVFDSLVDRQLKHISTSPRRYRSRKCFQV